MNMQTDTTMRDAAWATIHIPLEAEVLRYFCQDIERLFRINPMLYFKQWEIVENNRYRCSGQNISQEKPFDFDLTFSVKQLSNGLQIDYQQGLKSRTTFIIEPVLVNYKQQSKITITDVYEGAPETQRQQQQHLVDKSITVWASYLQQYLLTWKRWSSFAPWCWYMQYIWLPMKPSARRITYIVLWITVFEITLIVLGGAIYFLEYK